MEKIAANQEITPEAGVKIAAHGFVTMLGSPATALKPQEVQDLGVEFAKRASAAAQRHGQIKGLILDHVAAAD